MPWICWWRKPRTPSGGDAGLPGGKGEQITLCIEASDSNAVAKSARGTVLPPTSADAGRERFFRHRRSTSGQLLTLRSRPAQSSEPVTLKEARPSTGRVLQLA